MSDMWGRRPAYLSWLLIFAVGTAWCAAAQSIGHFIAGRTICGVGAGALISMGNIVVNDLVKMEARGTYKAYINLLYGGGAAAGAAFGGYLCETIGWRATFAGQVPFVLFAYAMAYYTLPDSLGPMLANDKHWSELLPEFDLAGSFFLFISVASLILGLNCGGNIYSWSHPIVVSALFSALITVSS
jgi:MFS family permease